MREASKYGSIVLWLACSIAAIVLFSGHRSAVASAVSGQDTTGITEIADSAGTFDHGIEKLEGFALVNRLPSRIPFGEGENLLFNIRYGLITAGEATLEIRNIAVLEKIKAYHIVSNARTNKAFDAIFKVRDRHESFMEYDDLYSLRFIKHLREGKFKKDSVVDFDQKKHVAIYKDKEVAIPPNTHDFLTALYYIRTLDMDVGQAVAMPNHTDGKNYPIFVKVLRREKVKVPAGEFDCIVVEPVLETSSIFENKGKLTIWMTNDSLKIPVMMSSKVIVGAFEAVLKEFTLSTDPVREFEQKAD